MLQVTDEYKNLKGGFTLADDQVEGVQFLLQRKNALLSYQTGLGKTITALVTSKIILDNFPNARIIISCPVKALKAWKRDLFGKLGMSRNDVSIYATSEFVDIRTAKYFIFTDTNLEKYLDVVQELYQSDYKLVFLIDEAHKLQDKKSKVYEVCKQVRNMSTLVYSISATPILNDLDGLYNIVNFVCPKFLGNKTDFDNRYTKRHLENIYVKGGAKRKIWVLDGYQNLDELNERLKQVMIIRSKEYNLKFTEVCKSLTDAEMSVYERVSSGIVTQASSKEDERNFSKRMHDLQRFLDRAYEGDDSIKELVEEYNANEYSTKEEMLIDALKGALAQKFAVIVYADYKDTIARLHKVLKSRRVELGLSRIYEITGSINIKEREKVEDKISPGDVVLISSAGSESIDLQKCSCLIYYDIPFSIKVVVQTLGRICRRNTEFDTQYVVVPYIKGTIDEYKFLMFKQHIDLVKKAVGIANDIPFEMMTVDQNTMKQLRDKLLWKYKGDPEEKKRRKEKRLIKGLIRTCNVTEAKSVISNNKFLIEPVGEYDFDSNLKEVHALFPDADVYDRYVRGEVPFTVLRSKYRDFLTSERGTELRKALIAGVKKSSDLVLVGNTELTEVLKESILEVYD